MAEATVKLTVGGERVITHGEGVGPVHALDQALREALRTALTPQIETTKAVGIVFLPGAMTGLILAGVSALDAVRVQIVVMYMVLAAVAVATATAKGLHELDQRRPEWIVGVVDRRRGGEHALARVVIDDANAVAARPRGQPRTRPRCSRSRPLGPRSGLMTSRPLTVRNRIPVAGGTRSISGSPFQRKPPLMR